LFLRKESLELWPKAYAIALSLTPHSSSVDEELQNAINSENPSHKSYLFYTKSTTSPSRQTFLSLLRKKRI